MSAPILIDTHAHLYLPEFDDDRQEMLQRAKDAGVSEIYLPNIDSGSIKSMLALEKANPDLCHAMMGLHPCSVSENVEEELAIVKGWLERRTFSAIGEIGTDHYWDVTHARAQERAFEQQILWAKDYGLPIVIHSRETLDLNIEIVGRHAGERLRGIFHCFTGTVEQGRQIIEMGFYLGIGGVVTFRNSGLAEVIAALPLDAIVLETDAPYLTPHPYRGKRNESAYTRLVAQKIAEVRGISIEEVSEATTRNARQVFGQAG